LWVGSVFLIVLVFLWFVFVFFVLCSMLV
jgi:hypothetical protein